MCSCFHAAAQQQAGAGFAVESNIIAGKVLKHTQKFRAPIPDLSTAYEINFLQQTYGKKQWQQRRKYPLVGFGFTITNYGIDSIYGKCISMYPILQLPIIRGKKLEWTFRIGFGMGYVTKRYDRIPDWDTLNNAISSHVNNFSTISTDLRYHINKHLDLQLGGNFSHISNAALKQPNLGINMYGAHIGLRYFPVTSKPEKIHEELPKLKNRWLFQARLGLAFNQAGFTDGPMYPIYLASAFVSRRWHSNNKMFAGIDYSYHTNIYAFQRNNEINVGNEAANSWKSAVFVGNEFLMGRVGIVLQVGYYIKEAALRLDPYYEKIGGNLYLIQRENGPLKELCVSAFLKTHKAQAELAEMGLGFGF
ncbi:acyloxyacyl hydrolase [Chitinophagaceae bacterium MMS25-I14]